MTRTLPGKVRCEQEWKMMGEAGQGALGPSPEREGGEQGDSHSSSGKDCMPGGGITFIPSCSMLSRSVGAESPFCTR